MSNTEFYNVIDALGKVRFLCHPFASSVEDIAIQHYCGGIM